MSLFGQAKTVKRGRISSIGPATQKGALGAFAGRIRKAPLILVGAYVVMVLAMSRDSGRQTINIEDIGERVRRGEDIVAPFSFETVDLDRTEEARAAAAATVPDYYRVDRAQVETQVEVLDQHILRLRTWRPAVEAAVTEALRASFSDQDAVAVMEAAVALVAQEVVASAEFQARIEPAAVAAWLRPDPGSLPERVFADPASRPDAPPETPRPVLELLPRSTDGLSFSDGDRLADLATTTLRHLLQQGVRVGLAPSDSRAHLLRAATTAEAGQPNQMLLSELPDWDQVLEIHNQWLQNEARARVREGEDSSGWAKLLDNALKMARLGLGDVIRPDLDATADARLRAREAVAPVMRTIEANIIIQQKNHYWTPQSRVEVETLVKLLESTARPRQRTAALVLSNCILAALAIALLHRSVDLLAEHASVRPETQFHLSLLVISGTLLGGRIVWYFEPTGFLLPAAASAILLAILVNARLAVIVGMLNAALLSVPYGYEWRVLVLVLAMSLAGAVSIYKVRRRSDMAAASLKATLAGLLAVAAMWLALDAGVAEDAWRRLLLVAMNGAICLLIVPGLLSPLERLFNLTTDIQLLEYSDLNNELLGQLAIKAPGTFAHSLMLGHLAEAAAERIGANGLLARVCAYYHDIGKMRRSEYFTENQTEHNIHDTLTPRQSSRAIAAHVLQGAQMAREYHLPKPIADGILEHHGTCMIGYFYQLALDQRKHGDVKEADFRYPGPKPQRPETAILMICDACESGVRSIKNPNEERVREFIDKIIESRSADGQFDECDLTLKQLNTIAEVLTTRIMTSLHTRVAYPDLKKDRPPDNVIKLSGGAE